MGMRVRRIDYLWNNWGLRFIWDEGTSIGKEEDRPFLSGLMKERYREGYPFFISTMSRCNVWDCCASSATALEACSIA